MHKTAVKILMTGMVLGLALVLAAPASAQLKAGDAAPEFRLPRADGSGQVALSDFRDKKIVIVHFWKSR